MRTVASIRSAIGKCRKQCALVEDGERLRTQCWRSSKGCSCWHEECGFPEALEWVLNERKATEEAGCIS